MLELSSCEFFRLLKLHDIAISLWGLKHESQTRFGGYLCSATYIHDTLDTNDFNTFRINRIAALPHIPSSGKMKQYEAMQDEWWNTSGTLWISLGSLQNCKTLQNLSITPDKRPPFHPTPNSWSWCAEMPFRSFPFSFSFAKDQGKQK